MVRSIVGRKLELIEKDDFIATRKAPVRFRDLSEEEQAELIKSDPEYGEIICRCQKVTKREIREAAHRATEDFVENLPNSRSKLEKILEVMLYAHISAALRRSAEEIFATLQ
jgi:F0F1-type ATP synthase membrane subunit b/b'